MSGSCSVKWVGAASGHNYFLVVVHGINSLPAAEVLSPGDGAIKISHQALVTTPIQVRRPIPPTGRRTIWIIWTRSPREPRGPGWRGPGWRLYQAVSGYNGKTGPPSCNTLHYTRCSYGINYILLITHLHLDQTPKHPPVFRQTLQSHLQQRLSVPLKVPHSVHFSARGVFLCPGTFCHLPWWTSCLWLSSPPQIHQLWSANIPKVVINDYTSCAMCILPGPLFRAIPSNPILHAWLASGPLLSNLGALHDIIFRYFETVQWVILLYRDPTPSTCQLHL